MLSHATLRTANITAVSRFLVLPTPAVALALALAALAPLLLPAPALVPLARVVLPAPLRFVLAAGDALARPPKAEEAEDEE